MTTLRGFRTLVLGATGFLGSAVCRRLEDSGVTPIRTSLSLGVDFREYDQIRRLFDQVRPETVLNCASLVGGIQFGYDHPIELFNDNLLMSVNLYRACRDFQIRRLVNPISNCIYPSKATLFREDEVWDGPLDQSVLVYGMARKMHWVGALAYRREAALDSVNIVLPNMYGPGDHFDPIRSHALGAMIAKIVHARQNHEPKVTIWGTGTPVREWLYIDDGADAMMKAACIDGYEGLINVGTGRGVSVIQLAEMIKAEVGYEGTLELDPSRPDGAPRKTLDGSRARELLRWEPAYTLDVGLRRTVEWFLAHRAGAR